MAFHHQIHRPTHKLVIAFDLSKHKLEPEQAFRAPFFQLQALYAQARLGIRGETILR